MKKNIKNIIYYFSFKSLYNMGMKLFFKVDVLSH